MYSGFNGLNSEVAMLNVQCSTSVSADPPGILSRAAQVSRSFSIGSLLRFFRFVARWLWIDFVALRLALAPHRTCTVLGHKHTG